MNNEISKYIGPAEAALRLGVNAMTVRRLCDKGTLEFMITPGGHRRILAESVENYLKQLLKPKVKAAPTRLKVLLVDDDMQIIELLKLFIEKSNENIAFETAQGGFEAGLKIAEFKPDVVVTDLLMPDLNGIEVCQRLKSNPKTKHIRVIGMTGTGDAKLIDEFVGAGAQICLTKPMKRKDFIEAIMQ